MNRKMRIIGIVALLFFVAGCSGYRTLGSFNNGYYGGPGLGDLKPGEYVRLHLLTGSKIPGKVLEVSKESLTLILADPNAWEVDDDVEEVVEEFAFQDLETIEIREGGGVGNTIAAIVIVGAVVGVGIAAYVGSTMDMDPLFSTTKADGPILSHQ